MSGIEELDDAGDTDDEVVAGRVGSGVDVETCTMLGEDIDDWSVPEEMLEESWLEDIWLLGVDCIVRGDAEVETEPVTVWVFVTVLLSGELVAAASSADLPFF